MVKIAIAVFSICVMAAIIYVFARLIYKSRSDYVSYARAKSGGKRRALWVFGVFPFEGTGERTSGTNESDLDQLRSRMLGSYSRLWVFVFLIALVAISMKLIGS